MEGMFDSDPVDRAGKGVRHHQVLRADGDRDLVCIELTFDTAAEAQTLLDAMGEVWKRIGNTVIAQPTATMFEVAEEKVY